MKLLKLSLPVFVALAHASAQATPILLNADLSNMSVFANTYDTHEANSTVYGNILSGDVLTIGASGVVNGDITSVNASNVGGLFNAAARRATITGNLLSGGVSTAGDSASVVGNLTSSGAATIGAKATVGGKMVSGDVLTTGDTSRVGGNVLSTGAGSIGANGKVGGNMTSGGAISLGANAVVTGTVTPNSPPNTGTNGLTASLATRVNDDMTQLAHAQTALTSMGTGTTLIPVTGTMTLDPGIYSAASLSPTASSIISLDAHNMNNQSWLFNITDILAFGASTTVKVINGGTDESVVWNVGNGYATIGAGAYIVGAILAKTYIELGADATVTGYGSSCGGVFSQTSYVSAGDGSVIGATGCTSVNTVSAVPVPAGFTLFISGLGLMGFMVRRKKQA